MVRLPMSIPREDARLTTLSTMSRLVKVMAPQSRMVRRAATSSREASMERMGVSAMSSTMEATRGEMRPTTFLLVASLDPSLVRINRSSSSLLQEERVEVTKVEWWVEVSRVEWCGEVRRVAW